MCSTGCDCICCSQGKFEHKIGAIIVLNGDQLVGILSERDLLTRVVTAGLDPAEFQMKDVMTTNLFVADANDIHVEAMKN